MDKLERRAFAADELRAAGDKNMLIGHAAVFNQLSDDLGGFREQVAPGAFAETIGADDVRALFNHSPMVVLGRSKAGTLRLKEDATGLAIEIDLPDTQAAKDLGVSIGRRDISQMSFGFQTVTDKWEKRDGATVRTLIKVKLFDVSPVTMPAYPQTDVAQRALAAWQAEQRPNAVPLSVRRRQLQILTATTRV